jgi:hypothetical protein
MGRVLRTCHNFTWATWTSSKQTIAGVHVVQVKCASYARACCENWVVLLSYDSRNAEGVRG